MATTEQQFDELCEAGKNKFKLVLTEFKNKKLKASNGIRVTNRNQAIAIAFSEARSACKGG